MSFSDFLIKKVDSHSDSVKNLSLFLIYIFY